MLSFFVETSDKKTMKLPAPVSVVYNSEYSVPADNISLSLPYVGEGADKADFIFAYEGDRLVFKGVVDEVITLCSFGGMRTKINARSMAGVLLDNEAQPNVYTNATPEFIFKNNLKPFGFTEFDAGTTAYYGNLNINKGMSEWQVLENYCRNKYSSIPRVEGNGRVIFDGILQSEKIVFSEHGEHSFSSFIKNIKKYRSVSEVRLRLKENSGYRSVLKNENYDSSVMRRRFVDALSGRRSASTADKILNESVNSSFEITLECPYRLFDVAGKRAEVQSRTFGTITDLYIHSLRYTLDKNGEKTTVVLRKVR